MNLSRRASSDMNYFFNTMVPSFMAKLPFSRVATPKRSRYTEGQKGISKKSGWWRTLEVLSVAVRSPRFLVLKSAPLLLMLLICEKGKWSAILDTLSSLGLRHVASVLLVLCLILKVIASGKRSANFNYPRYILSVSK